MNSTVPSGVSPSQGDRESHVTSAISSALATLLEIGVTTELAQTPVVWPSGFPDVLVRLSNTDAGSTGARGKGQGLQAIASALFEGLEHYYTLRLDEKEPVVYPTAEVERLDKAFISMDATFAALTAAVEAGDRIEIVAMTSMSTGAKVLLPAAAVDHAHTLKSLSTPNARRAARYASNSGYAAGATRQEALLHALCEVIERDAFSEFLVQFIHNATVVATEIVASAERMSEISKMARNLPAMRDTKVVNLPALAGTAVLAHCAVRDRNGRLVVGLGCSVDPEYAVHRAVIELQQELMAERNSDPETDGDRFSKGLLGPYPNLCRAAIIPDFAIVRPLEGKPTRATEGDVAGRIKRLSHDLRKRGFTVLYRELTNAQPNEPCVVQVVVPGAEKFHLVREGMPVEPIGRLRDRSNIKLCRQRDAQSQPS